MNRALTLIASAAITTAACDNPPPPAPTDTRAVSLEVTGTFQLGNVGDTSQLKATATFSDGRREDVTASTEWSTNESHVATITTAGVLTARSFGLTSVRGFYYSRSQFRQVVVTPPGTFILTGRVREPGAGSMGGVTVRHIASGESVVTATNGRYLLSGMTDPPRLSLTKTGYEPAEFQAVPNFFLEPAIQPIIRVTPELTTGTILAPNDLEYVVSANGGTCQPCRLVRVSSPVAGTLRIRVSWDDADGAVNIWTNGQFVAGNSTTREIAADIAVVAGETIIHLGRLPGTTRLFLHTSLSITTGAVF